MSHTTYTPATAGLMPDLWSNSSPDERNKLIADANNIAKTNAQTMTQQENDRDPVQGGFNDFGKGVTDFAGNIFGGLKDLTQGLFGQLQLPLLVFAGVAAIFLLKK